jgi:hypothetical protein
MSIANSGALSIIELCFVLVSIQRLACWLPWIIKLIAAARINGSAANFDGIESD